ncbi:MAG: response regulator [Bacteroidetes bacterium]|nr:response regulator [Bacteroidota bacterium]
MALNKILLVDDSEPFNYLSKAVLADNKVTCVINEALNGQEALDYLEREETCPDVILLDLNMPVMDGFDFLEEYAKREKCHAHTKIFVLTSSNRAEDKDRAVKNKFVMGYFDKPLSYFHIKEIQTFFEE